MISKRQLGLALLLIGCVVVLGPLAMDWLGFGQFDGVGPVQKLAMAAGGLVALVGLSLIPLGKRPA